MGILDKFLFIDSTQECLFHVGGGAALLHLSELVPSFKDSLTDAEEKLGADIVMKALRSPCRIIAENAGDVVPIWLLLLKE